MLARLSAEAQEDLRRRVVEAVQKGLSQTEVARVFGVARGTVNRWMGMVERAGQRALKARRRGRPAVSRLKPHQAATTVRHILSGCPDQLSLPFALWTREAVQEFADAEVRCRGFGVDGRALFAGLGFDTAKTGAPGVRTKSGGGTEMVGAGISLDSRTGAPVEGANSLVRRDWGCAQTIKRGVPTDGADRRRWYGEPVSAFAAT